MEETFSQNEIALFILNALDYSIFVSDVDSSEIIYINDTMIMEFNLKENPIGKNAFEVFNGNRGKDCKRFYSETPDEENFMINTWEEYNSVNKKYYRNTDSFVTWIDGKTVHLRQCIDITQEQTLLNKLTQAKQETNIASKAKSDFLARMKRNINSPINSIIGLSRIALQTTDANKTKKCLLKIEGETNRLSNTIGDVFDMAKIESDNLELINEPFSFENMLIGVSNEIKEQCASKSQMFQIRMDMEMPAYFVGDEQRISQIINHLLDNASKYTPEGGKIQIEVNQVSLINNLSTIDISVSDTGVGIDPKQFANITKLFEETNVDEIRLFKGVGLGLPLAKSIVNMMGGEMRLYSSQNIGSVFSFTIKLEVFESRFFNRKLLPGLNIKNLNVLLVDDSYEVCEYFTKIMNGFKIDCDTSTTSIGLIDKLEMAEGKRRPYNIVFLDMNLKDMDFSTIAKVIKNKFINTTIVGMTTQKDSRLDRACYEAGISKIISKPLFPSLLLDVINEIVTIPSRKQLTYIADKYDFAGKSILLVEDVKINQEIITKYLKDTNAKLYYADNGQIALEMFLQDFEKFDLILMDVNMPEMDGHEATRHIRNLAPSIRKSESIPIIALTANLFEQDIQKSMDSGMNDHITKPLEADELLEKISVYLQSSSKKDIICSEYMNIEDGLKRVRGNEKVYKALLGNFIRNSKFGQLKREVEVDDFEMAFKTAHRIKGTASNLALIEVEEIMNILEHSLLDCKDTRETLAEAEKIINNTFVCIESYLDV